jgi:hypothetical protein
MTHDEIIEILQAHRDGKILQTCCITVHDAPWLDWTPTLDTLLDVIAKGQSHYQVRVKPEPLTVYIPQCPDGRLAGTTNGQWFNTAEDLHKCWDHGYHAQKFVSVED